VTVDDLVTIPVSGGQALAPIPVLETAMPTRIADARSCVLFSRGRDDSNFCARIDGAT